MEALWSWNVQIPFSIINGDHNAFQHVAQENGMIVVVDRRGADSSKPLLDKTEGYLGQACKDYQIIRLDING